jgi:hypothetical protein
MRVRHAGQAVGHSCLGRGCQWSWWLALCARGGTPGSIGVVACPGWAILMRSASQLSSLR